MGGLAIAALLVACLVAPFVLDQLATVRARGGGSPIVVSHYTVFGELFPYPLRRLIDIPGYWLIILPVELPAAFFAGVIALTLALRSALPALGKTRRGGFRLPGRCRSCRFMAPGLYARRQQ